MKRPPNDYHRLRKAFQIAVGILASRAYGCGACPPSSENFRVYTPPANGPDGGGDGGLPYLDQATCDRLCGDTTISCSYASTDAGGAVVLRCETPLSCGAGRRPQAFSAMPIASSTSLGAWLSEIADLEAASVDAFVILERELAAHGAPASLRRRARAAAADEVRHARVVARHARRRGATVVRRPKMVRSAPRTLLAIALENAVEGCVRETFAALLAEVSAARATDPELRSDFGAIAEDETRHAALAHAVRRFLDGKLTPEERAEVDRAYAAALDRLEHEAPVLLGDQARAEAGLPEPAELRALARALANELRRSDRLARA